MKLLVLWKLLHGVEVYPDDFRQYTGVEILTELALAEVEQARCCGHLDVEHGLILMGRLDNELKYFRLFYKISFMKSGKWTLARFH